MKFDHDDIAARLAALRIETECLRRRQQLRELHWQIDANMAKLDDAIARTRAALGLPPEDEDGTLGVRQPVTPKGPAPLQGAMARKEPR